MVVAWRCLGPVDVVDRAVTRRIRLQLLESTSMEKKIRLLAVFAVCCGVAAAEVVRVEIGRAHV